MASFSDQSGINDVKKRLAELAPGIQKSLEIERITMFPKVRKRLSNYKLTPNKGVSCVGQSDSIETSEEI